MSETPQDPYTSGNPYEASQPAYGQQPYGQPTYGGYQAPDHQQATTVLVLGILGLVLCQVLAPFAWVMGNRVVREIDASGGALGGRSSANAGRICGIIGSVFLGLGVLLVVGFIALAIIAGATST